MNKKKNKYIVDEYYSDIYQVKLVVANKDCSIEYLRKRFIEPDDKELSDEILVGIATTSKCYDKKTGEVCILVKYNRDTKIKSINKKFDFINTCSHEATHVALDIYELIGQQLCFCTPEPFCYLQGWATERIYKTLTK